jgi:hypothetical protein
MEIYTLVSLCIGIFGASYAALNAMRTHLDPLVSGYCTKAAERLEEVKMKHGDAHKGTLNCKKHHYGTKFWRGIWTTAHIIPAAVFFIAMLVIAPAVLWNWDDIIAKHDNAEALKELFGKAPWSYFYTGFLWMCVLDLLAVIGAVFAWWRCRCSLSRVGELGESLTAPELTDPK